MASAAGARDLGRAIELPQHKLAADFTSLGSPVAQTAHLWLLSPAPVGLSHRGYAGGGTGRALPCSAAADAAGMHSGVVTGIRPHPRQRCRQPPPCVIARQARAGREAGDAEGSEPLARCFATADADRYITLIAVGLTVTDAARQCGWNLATSTTPASPTPPSTRGE
jgi:hypothetical protein